MPAPITEEEDRRDREALLDATEALFYARGVQAVGMDQIRTTSGLPLKRIYRLFATKEDLVVGVLRRRDQRWRARLSAYVEQVTEPRARVLAIFDWLAGWFAETGFRGCAWINVHGELGSTSAPVAAEVRAHKQAFHEQIHVWARAAGLSDSEPVALLAEGAIVTAGITGDPVHARHARAAVEKFLTKP
ncbi:TetR/AcrR family transcriptional regulator [Spongiactinospora gelatinilytica]|uniref:TetR/AcrR family transcriptional regulator n=1 Tax=Spongiactinospora gelatinilytica TaxID=2666298 RepID=A0A2W2HIC6_9ACTN|nr:TetR/AcrR family transcriptional regulator [Spongiactinospora gelatinilytica]PZG51425.1 TetR/AcrR family transcriptional regulator [Spongiactinospora gelatinilytica]